MMTQSEDEGTSGAAESTIDRHSGGARPKPGEAVPGLFDALPQALLLIDAAGTIVRANPACEAMFGFPAEELIGAPVDRLFPDRQRRPGAPAYRDILLGGASAACDGDLTARSKTGIEFPLDVEACSLVTPDGERHCLTLIDATTRRRAALRLYESETLLEEMAQAISRDLHNQIHEVATVVAFGADVPGSALPGDASRSLRRVSNCLADVEHLLGDLVIYSRARHFPLPTEPIDFNAVVDETIVREAPGAGVSIDVAATGVAFVGARAALAGVLRSLLSNSIKHHDRADVRIQIHARLEGDICVIDYAD